MTAYIYLLNGRIHTIENCINIISWELDDSIVFWQQSLATRRCSNIKYPQKDIANISIQL